MEGKRWNKEISERSQTFREIFTKNPAYDKRMMEANTKSKSYVGNYVWVWRSSVGFFDNQLGAAANLTWLEEMEIDLRWISMKLRMVAIN